MNQFQTIIDFFRQIQPGDYITRKMYMDTMKGDGLTESALDNIRCHLMRAGYIYDGPNKIAGIYYIARRIPKNITSNQLYEQAYGRKEDTRFKPNVVHYQLSPDLSDITGLRIASSSEVMKAFWNYVTKNQLQAKHNPRIVNAGTDPQFKAVIGGKRSIHLFEIMKELRKHMTMTGFRQVKER